MKTSGMPWRPSVPCENYRKCLLRKPLRVVARLLKSPILGSASALLSLTLIGLAGTGCVTRREVDLTRAREIEKIWQARRFDLTPSIEAQILALDPEHVSEHDIRGVLSKIPAPRIVKIRGGTRKVYRRMASFSEFLIGMGYPVVSITDPGDGRYAYNCYGTSEQIAGVLGWYYEHEGLRPMLIGHSQGGMEVVKVLHLLAHSSPNTLPLWNPLTWRSEGRTGFTDPLSGRHRTLSELVLPYASSVGAGGLTRALPNQWNMTFRLRDIPDSVEEFTGFCKGMDLLGGDFLGYGPANEYSAQRHAQVQNVWLPDNYSHATLLETKHLTTEPSIRDWLNNYQPSALRVSRPQFTALLPGNTENILWAAEIWYRIKKHWVLELQRYVHARQIRNT